MNRRTQNQGLRQDTARQDAALARIPTASQGGGVSVDEYLNLITVQRTGKGTMGQVLGVTSADGYLNQRIAGRPTEHV